MERYDLIVVGAGSAARDAARKASTDFGATVALVESTRWGGFVPQRRLQADEGVPRRRGAAPRSPHARPEARARRAPSRADLRAIHAWKETLRRPQERWVADLHERGHDTYDGAASFVDPKTLRVGDVELTSERILVATGSRTAVPPIPGLDQLEWIDHVTALDLRGAARVAARAGRGPVGLEFAQIFARFGSRVSIVQTAPSHLAALRRRGHERPDGSPRGGRHRDLHRHFRREVRGRTANRSPIGRTVDAERVLLASGRAPNVEELGSTASACERTRAGSR
jgi:pyruvate/2-oxoglutarate dehydrogenase complex dihydrolipoamide dehydrogenase (E3) component